MALSKIVSVVLDYFNIKGGRLALIVSMSEVDYNNSATNIEDRKDTMRTTFSFSPIYSALHKVWEGMEKNNIITEVIWSIYNHIQFECSCFKLSSYFHFANHVGFCL